jgi:hypothetical protein
MKRIAERRGSRTGRDQLRFPLSVTGRSCGRTSPTVNPAISVSVRGAGSSAVMRQTLRGDG